MEKEKQKTDSWDEITGWTQLSFINNQSNHKNSWRSRFLDWGEMGRHVCGKLWIHFIAADTSGHNNLVGHMNGGRPTFIYQECRFLFDDLSSHIPMCSLITSEELKQARLTEDGLTNLCKKHFQCFWECPFWWPEVWITRICSCRNVTCQLHWLTQTHVWLSW